MGTALDIDDDVLQAGEEIARREGKTSGEVISALARAALPDSRELQTGRSGSGLFPGVAAS